jgi:hypothetical protein
MKWDGIDDIANMEDFLNVNKHAGPILCYLFFDCEKLEENIEGMAVMECPI